LPTNEKFAVQFHQQLKLQISGLNCALFDKYCLLLAQFGRQKKASHPVCSKKPRVYVDEIDPSLAFYSDKVKIVVVFFVVFVVVALS